MSLLKRLWISIGTLLLTVFLVTLAVFGISGSMSLEQQLAIDTEKAANILALSLSAQELDPVTIEIQLSTLPNLSEFKSVELRDATGERVFQAENTPPTPNAPALFVSLFEVSTPPVTASVQQGWDNWTLELVAFGGSVYDELWTATKRSALAMLAAFAVAGIIGQSILADLLTPLTHVVAQAAGIGRRRFTKIDIPSTTEFAAVARSMNELSDRVQTMLSDEATRLKDRKASSDLDDTTGLLNRITFMERLTATLTRENEESTGSIALIRLLRLADMNRQYGRQLIDNLLKQLGNDLQGLNNPDSYGGNCSIGRLNGADICAIATNENTAKNLADAMQRKVRYVLRSHGIDESYHVAAACIDYQYGDSSGALLAAMDGALAQSELQAGAPVVPAQRSQPTDSSRSSQQFWIDNLANALTTDALSLHWFPARRKDGSMIHLEGMARLTVAGTEFNAGEFMPWVFRLGLGQAFDRAVVSTATATLSTTPERLHVNLSSDSLRGTAFTDWLGQHLAQLGSNTERFGVEVSESAVLTAQPAFDTLVSTVKAYGGSVGIEHMGYRPEIIAELGHLGPDYLKVDSLYTQALTSNQGNRAVLASFCSVANSLGVDCIAEGVHTDKDREEAFNVGAKGVSGKAVG